jgi:hypothetical protein
MGEKMVGARGFEPPTPDTPCQCATRLRYAPKNTKKQWNDGMMEHWNTGFNKEETFFSIALIHHSNIPRFHYSNMLSVYSISS